MIKVYQTTNLILYSMVSALRVENSLDSMYWALQPQRRRWDTSTSIKAASLFVHANWRM
jgi:hypothetical protein